jgi:chemotaxis protein CheC
MDLRQLGVLQIDGLREVASIGAGHAATALSQLTHQRISLEVPKLQVIQLDRVPHVNGHPDEVVAAVMMQVLGDVTGRTIQIFPANTARRLAGRMIGTADPAFPDGFGELEQSALKEAGNILAGAYLNALSDFLGLLLLMSVPGLAIARADAVLRRDYLKFSDGNEQVLLIDTVFHMEGERETLRGHFLLLPDTSSLQVILRAIRLA